MVAHTFVSEVLDAVQDGLSLPDSSRVHLFYLESQTLIRVQDLILSEKCFCYQSSATSITTLCSKAILVKQSIAMLSTTKPYLLVCCTRDLYIVVVIRDVFV